MGKKFASFLTLFPTRRLVDILLSKDGDTSASINENIINHFILKLLFYSPLTSGLKKRRTRKNGK